MSKDGRVPAAPGSREPSPAVSALSGFDPARGMTVGGHFLDARVLRPAVDAMQNGRGIDYFEAWDVTWPLLPACKRRGLNASYVAGRLLQWARKEGFIRHRGRGQWVRCDSDRSGEAMETAKTGSTEGESAVAQPIAQPSPPLSEQS